MKVLLFITLLLCCSCSSNSIILESRHKGIIYPDTELSPTQIKNKISFHYDRNRHIPITTKNNDGSAIVYYRLNLKNHSANEVQIKHTDIVLKDSQDSINAIFDKKDLSSKAILIPEGSYYELPLLFEINSMFLDRHINNDQPIDLNVKIKDQLYTLKVWLWEI